MPTVHPTAIVDSQARLGEGVEIGAYCVVEADVEIGAGTELRPHVIIRRHTTMGEENFVDSFSVLGGIPQDLKFDAVSTTYLRIGDGNVFREGVTISRATGEGQATVVGNGVFMMAASHVGHNAILGDNTTLVNSALVAGHAEIDAGAIISGNCGVHQFCWMGSMAMMSVGTFLTKHLPPYVIATGVNEVAGLNVVGLRRAGHISSDDFRQIKSAFRLTYRSGLTPTAALERMDNHTDWGEPADAFRQFVRRVVTAEAPYRRGLCPSRSA